MAYLGRNGLSPTRIIFQEKGSFPGSEAVPCQDHASRFGTAQRLRRLSFHSWRHWFNSQLIEARVPPEKIRMLTGHSGSQVTLLYHHTQVDAQA